jgi:hypothetical protein
MRPDCSLRVSVADKGQPFDDVWVHFDAKYRATDIYSLFGRPDQVEDADVVPDMTQGLRAKRDDLLKMHTYIDAIRRTAGSYVLYPGPENSGDRERWSLYHELLPGLGAFGLRPAEDLAQPPYGLSALQRFTADLLDHAASVMSQHRRHRFWEGEVYAPGNEVASHAAWSIARKPPADTSVLLGYVRDLGQYNWIRRNLRYNLRAGGRRGAVDVNGRELSVEIVVLYGPPLTISEIWLVDGNPEVWRREDLLATGYPDPHGSNYFCLALAPVPQEDWNMPSTQVSNLRSRLSPSQPTGHPVATAWLELIR